MKVGVWLIAVMFSTAAGSQGQSAAGSLQGKVVDQSGAPIPQASVMVLDGTGQQFSLTTDQAGQFAFADAPGMYRVTTRAVGFRTAQQPMTFDPNATLIITLAVGTGGGVSVDPIPPMPLQAHEATAAPNESPVRQWASAMAWEYGALFQGGFGVTENRGGYHFFLAGAHVGKVLTPEIGTGLLRGNFEYAAELFPYAQANTPRFQKVSCPADPGTGQLYICSQPYTAGGAFHGVSVTPIILRWNFTHGQRWMPWAQGAGGLLWTNHKFPPVGDTNPQDLTNNGLHGDTSVWNFTPQFGVGTHYFLTPRRSIDVGGHAVHISSASLGDRNPGVNASVQFDVGFTWWK